MQTVNCEIKKINSNYNKQTKNLFFSDQVSSQLFTFDIL